MKLIFLGPPGAGKGTQAERIAEAQQVAHISTGDMLRAEMRHGTELGIAAKELIERGELVPDEIIIRMVEQRVQQPDCENGFLLDGFPRTVAQADALAAFAAIDHVVDLDVPFDRLIDRISGRRMCPECGAAYHIASHSAETCDHCGAKLYQRDDDTAETVRNRLHVYQEQTQPLIDYYRERGLLRKVNGDQDVDAVTSEVEKAIG